MLNEKIEIDLEKGDVIRVGRFKNKRIEVKEIGEDEFGGPTVNGRSILKVRIEKFIKNADHKIVGNKVIKEKIELYLNENSDKDFENMENPAQAFVDKLKKENKNQTNWNDIITQWNNFGGYNRVPKTITNNKEKNRIIDIMKKAGITIEKDFYGYTNTFKK